MRLTIWSDFNDPLVEDNALTDVGLSGPGGSQESDEWSPYPNKTVSVL